jgi:predicted DNA-binding transcriptional regulator AlpA
MPRQECKDRKHHLDKRARKIIAEGEDKSPDELLTTEAVAHWFDVSTQFLEIGRSKKYKYGPPFVRVGPKVVRYKRSAVLRWLESRTFNSTAEYPTRKREQAA